MVAMSIDTAPAAAAPVVPGTTGDTARDAAPDRAPEGVSDEAPETSSDGAPGSHGYEGAAPTGGWLVEQRGSFLVARCDACGHTTAARRARFSMETDMLRHGAECGEQGEPQPAVQTSGA